jgi:carboxyl-terminal processing protease
MIIKKTKILAILIFLIFSTSLSANSIEKENEFKLLPIVQDCILYDYVKQNIDKKELEYSAITGLLSALGDPYTLFLDPKRTSEMRKRQQGVLYGVGIKPGIKSGKLIVISCLLKSPASKAGIRSFDYIYSIDGELTKGMSLEEVRTNLRGAKDTEVVLGIKKPGNTVVNYFPIKRKKIIVKSVSKVQLFPNNIGYVKINSLESRNTTNELVSGIKKLKQRGMTSLILDLRNNGGGLLQNAIDIGSLFLKKKVLFYTLDRLNHKVTTYSAGIALFENIPLFLLVNESTASSAEILAGALKDNKRAVLIGGRTFGKASVQRIQDLPDGSSLLYTTAKYLTPLEIDISDKGVNVNINTNITKKQRIQVIKKFPTNMQNAIITSLSFF